MAKAPIGAKAKAKGNGGAGDNLPAVPSDVNLPVPAAERGVAPEVWTALKNTYLGASDEMTLAVWDYCKARELDPLKKPVHIVQTWDSKSRRQVETIWPGIALHRIEASRTGEYAGHDEPELGPMVKRQLGGLADFEFPEYCKFTVYRLVGGKRCAWTSVVYWLEAYARKGKDAAPNAMWAKRPRGQLEKCAESAALRAAFPEQFGGRYTADEMLGAEIGPAGEEMIDVTPDGEEQAEQPREPEAEIMVPEDKMEALEETFENGDGAEPVQPAEPAPGPENSSGVSAPEIAVIEPEVDPQGTLWGQWADKMKERVADCVSADELNAFVHAHTAVLEDLYKDKPDWHAAALALFNKHLASLPPNTAPSTPFDKANDDA